MKRRLLLVAGALTALVVTAGAVACGGGGGGEKETPTSAPPAATEMPSATQETAPSSAELAGHLATLKTVMEDTIANAQAGDVQGTRDAEGQGDEAIETLIKALRDVDPALADQLEALELDYEQQADSDSPDLDVIAQDAQGVLDLLDQVASTLDISQESGASSPDLAGDLATLKTVMEDTIAKAQAGDVQGTRDAEGQGDEAIETLIKAVREVDPSLADQLETLELDYEGQADSDNPDLDVIAQDAQGVLDLLDQVATTLNISP
jgi:hypothetical protein